MTLRAQAPSLPPNTPFKKVVIPLPPDLAIVSPAITNPTTTTPHLPPMHAPTQHPLLTIQRSPLKQSIAEAQEVSMALISWENSIIHLIFLRSAWSLTIIKVYHQVLAFRLSLDLTQNSPARSHSYRLVLNPQPREFLTQTPWVWRLGLAHQTNSLKLSPIKILVWNCRGAGNSNFRRNFLNLNRLHRPSIVVIMETRISSARANDLSFNLGFDSVCHSDVNGFSGGIWILWNSDETNLDILLVTDQAIQVCASNLDFVWLFSTIYVNPNLSTRLHLWEDLTSFTSFASSHSAP